MKNTIKSGKLLYAAEKFSTQTVSPSKEGFQAEDGTGRSRQTPPSNSPQTDGGRPDGSYILPHASSGVQHISQILPAVMANIRYRMQKRGMVSDG